MSEKEIKPGLLGRKVGMTQFFTGNGDAKGVTVIEVGPCVITQIKTQAKEGYNAIQLGFEETEFRRVNRAIRGHFEKKKQKPYRELKEFRVTNIEPFKVGQQLKVSAFQVGDIVDVTGISKGKGFQGVIKRHHKGGGPASHGSHFHRSTGSIGQRTWPGRVFKLMKLPGHMGARQVTTRNLKVVGVDEEKNYLVLEGSIPGGKNALVSIKTRKAADFEKRLLPAEPEKKEEPQEAPKEEVKADAAEKSGESS